MQGKLSHRHEVCTSRCPGVIYMGDRLKELPVELPLLYFTIETAARVREVLALVREGLPFDGPFTRGLYYKGTN